MLPPSPPPQLLEIYALEIQMHTEQKNNKMLKELYQVGGVGGAGWMDAVGGGAWDDAACKLLLAPRRSCTCASAAPPHSLDGSFLMSAPSLLHPAFVLQKALAIKSAIPHPRIMGVIRECGGKMHMHERAWADAATDFFEAFKSYDEVLEGMGRAGGGGESGGGVRADWLMPSAVCGCVFANPFVALLWCVAGRLWAAGAVPEVPGAGQHADGEQGKGQGRAGGAGALQRCSMERSWVGGAESRAACGRHAGPRRDCPLRTLPRAQVDPFDSQEARPYKSDSEVGGRAGLCMRVHA